MRSVIKFLESMSRRTKVLPKVTPPQEESITFAKLENILKAKAPSGLHFYKREIRPGYSIHHNSSYTNTDFKSLKEFFDCYGEDGSLLSEEKK